MLGCSQSAVFRDIITKCYDPIILFNEDRINDETFLMWKIMFLLPWFFRSFNKPVPLTRLFWTIAALNRGFLERLRLLPLIFLNILDTVKIEMSFCSCPVIIWQESFWKAFLMASWLITWGLPDRGWSFSATEAFNRCWTVILLTLSCFKISNFLKPARNKVDILSLFASIKRTWH